MAQALLLYGTSHCHLCEQAEELIVGLAELALDRPAASGPGTARDRHEDAGAMPLRRIDIAMDDALLERYGLRIPVLASPDGTTELDWPFDHGELLALLRSQQD